MSLITVTLHLSIYWGLGVTRLQLIQPTEWEPSINDVTLIWAFSALFFSAPGSTNHQPLFARRHFLRFLWNLQNHFFFHPIRLYAPKCRLIIWPRLTGLIFKDESHHMVFHHIKLASAMKEYTSLVFKWLKIWSVLRSHCIWNPNFKNFDIQMFPVF